MPVRQPHSAERSGTLVVLIWLLACGGDDATEGPLVVQRDTVGDTISVHWVSGSAWGRPARLRKELEIGELEGPEELIFGMISEMAVDRSGGILVFDTQVPALRYFDAQGSYVKTFGGEGQGPGEYGNRVRGLAIRGDGSVLLRDMRNRRINVYDSDGSVAGHWAKGGGLFTSQAMSVDTAGHVYVKVLLTKSFPPPIPWPVGLLELDENGEVVDTIQAPVVGGWTPSRGGRPRPAPIWEMHPFGMMVVGVNDTYAFEIRGADGRVVKVSRAYTPVAVTDSEFAEYEARRARAKEQEGDALLPTPRIKPAYKGFYFGQDGTIWVQRHMPAHPTKDLQGDLGPMLAAAPNWPFMEPVVFDVFEVDGTYLGEVEMPENTRPYVFGRDRIYAVRTGRYDEQYVVRFRLETGS